MKPDRPLLFGIDRFARPIAFSKSDHRRVLAVDAFILSGVCVQAGNILTCVEVEMNEMVLFRPRLVQLEFSGKHSGLSPRASLCECQPSPWKLQMIELAQQGQILQFKCSRGARRWCLLSQNPNKPLDPLHPHTPGSPVVPHYQSSVSVPRKVSVNI